MTLNLNRFAKVVAFARSIPHEVSRHSENQQNAAWNRAEAMAREAGLTLKAALEMLDGYKAKPEPAKPFFHHEMQAERDLEEAVRRYRRAHPSASMFDAVRHAKPWPDTIAAAVDELDEWEDLTAEMRRFNPNFTSGSSSLFTRRSLLNQFIEETPAADPFDMYMRARWMARLNPGAIAEAVSADLSFLVDRISDLEDRLAKASAKPAPRTNREKREAVAAILAEPGGWDLSIRELARMAGISIQGAKDIRLSLQAETVGA